MIEIDVDDIAEINYPESTGGAQAERVEVVFKDGTRKTFEGKDLPEVLRILNHWTPPTA